MAVRSSSRYSWRATVRSGAAADLPVALALGDAAAGGGPSRPVVDLAEHHDGGQGPVQLPVPAPVAAMADDLAEDAGTGAAPASMAKATSERNRPGWDRLISSWAALMGRSRAR